MLLALAATVLAGCGGGGGGDDGGNNGGNNPPPPANSGSITAANGQQIASVAVSSTLFVQDLGLPDVAGPFIPTAQAAGPVSIAALGPAMDNAFRRIANDMREVDAITEDTITCSLGGQILMTGNFEDETTLTVGDTLTLFFDACAENDGTLEGLVDMIVTEVTGDPNAAPFTVGLDVTLDGVTLTDEDSVQSADGTLGATLSAETDHDQGTLLVGTEIATAVGADTMVLRDFSIEDSNDFDQGSYTLALSGTMEDATLGDFPFETETTFVGSGGQFPHEGTLLIQGSNDTTLRVIALDAENVRIEIDENGDGTEDETVDTTWDELVDLS
jgi:hypothetical protein